MADKWKTTAIVFICLFFSLLAINAYGWHIIAEEEKAYAELERQTYDCYYGTCADYPDAELVGDYCTCYDIDDEGYYEAVETVYQD